jgi:hypothetical protein
MTAGPEQVAIVAAAKQAAEQASAAADAAAQAKQNGPAALADGGTVIDHSRLLPGA